jgi:osmotically-inducible protein OsmY
MPYWLNRQEEEVLPMKKTLSMMAGMVLLSTLSLSAIAQVPEKAREAGTKTAETSKKAAEKTADVTKSMMSKAKNKIAPKTDDQIQKCITAGLSESPKLKRLALNAIVANGEATLTGEAKSSGNKNTATGVARKCGAKKVTNNITIPGPTLKSEKQP